MAACLPHIGMTLRFYLQHRIRNVIKTSSCLTLTASNSFVVNAVVHVPAKVMPCLLVLHVSAMWFSLSSTALESFRDGHSKSNAFIVFFFLHLRMYEYFFSNQAPLLKVMHILH